MKNSAVLPSLLSLSIAITVSADDAPSTVLTDKKSSRLSLETVTVLGHPAIADATVGGVDIKRLPINIHVVGGDKIDHLRFIDPDEFLDRIPGETQVRNLRIPNGGKSYTIPMLDGIPLESPYEGATQRLDRVNTSDIKRVEIIKGPASAVYPNNAFGGVVNVVSRDPVSEPETKVIVEAGDLGHRRMGVTTAGTVDKVGYFLDLNTRDLDGMRDDAKDDKDSGSAKLMYTFSDATRLSGRYEQFKEEQVVRGDLTAVQLKEDSTQAGSLSSSTELEQKALSVKLEHTTAHGQWEASAVRRIKDTAGVSRFRGPQSEEDEGLAAKVFYKHDFAQSNVIAGYEMYQGDVATNSYARGDVDLAGPFTSASSELNIDAYFTQYQVDMTDRLIVTAGLRYEDINLSSSSYEQEANFSDVAPKIGINYQLNDSNTLWFGVSEGFYAPDLDDLFDEENGNPNLKPEEARNIEMGFRGQWQDWSYDASIYHNEITNYLVTQEFIDNNGFEFEKTTNAGQVTVQGIESVLEYAPHPDWRFGLTHTYAKNEYDQFVQSTSGASDDYSGNELGRSPRHHLNSRISWLPTDELLVELEGDFYSSYFSDDANSPAGKFTRDERIHLRISYDSGPWRVWLHGLNLTDTLEDRASYRRGRLTFRTIDGRHFYTGLSYQF